MLPPPSQEQAPTAEVGTDNRPQHQQNSKSPPTPCCAPRSGSLRARVSHRHTQTHCTPRRCQQRTSTAETSPDHIRLVLLLRVGVGHFQPVHAIIVPPTGCNSLTWCVLFPSPTICRPLSSATDHAICCPLL